MSLSGLRHDIQIGRPAPYVMPASARSDTAGDAGATASAVVRSYLQYAGSASSPAGRAPAHLLEPATSVTGTARLLRLLAGAGPGAVSGVPTGVITVVVSRRLTHDDPARLPGRPLDHGVTGASVANCIRKRSSITTTDNYALAVDQPQSLSVIETRARYVPPCRFGTAESCTGR